LHATRIYPAYPEVFVDRCDAPLKPEAFFQNFDSDGTIGKRDGAMGSQAFEQAKVARSKKRRGKKGRTTTRKGTSQFPFDREPSPIRQNVLNAIQQSQRG
jgi:hypothetical protein